MQVFLNQWNLSEVTINKLENGVTKKILKKITPLFLSTL